MQHESANAIDQPLGYCPSCDYQLLAAGVCPECGTDVAQDRIRSQPRRKRVRKWFIRISIVAIAAGLIFTGRWAIKEGLHYRLYTNSMLIDTYLIDKHANNEIKRRLNASAFAQDDVDSLIEKSFTIELSVRSPRPRGIRAACDLTITTKPGAFFRIAWDRKKFRDIVVIKLDGNPIDSSDATGDISTVADSQWNRGHYPTWKTPGIGRHEFEFDIDAQCALFDPQIAVSSEIELNLRAGAAAEFVVEDRSIWEIMACKDAPGDIAYLKDTFKMSARRHRSESTLGTRIDGRACTTNAYGSSHEYYAFLRWRTNGAPSEERLGVLRFNRLYAQMKKNMIFDRDIPINDETRITCRWVPNVSYYFNSYSDAFYPFALEWDFELVIDAHLIDPSHCDCESSCARPPDRILHLKDIDPTDEID